MDPIAPLFALLVGAVLAFLYVVSIFWAFFDARARGKSGCLVALLVLVLTWPLGLLLWFVFRPERK